MLKQYKGVTQKFSRYWQNYGGIGALFCSPYLHISLLITLLSYNFWSNAGKAWWTHNLSILPNILGFTLGGFALFLGIGSDKFREILISMPSDNACTNPYSSAVAAFVHFAVVQLLAILVGVIGNAIVPRLSNALTIKIFGFVGYGLFVYSLTLALSVCLSIFSMANLYAQYQKIKDKH